MGKLTKATLVGGGLILIDRAETVRRYRACMERLGLEPTKLDTFHIDGIGWSPEIADEKKDRDFLSHGVANPVGIIVTANQFDRPIYMPAHSFDRVMLRAYFEENHAAIADLTTQTGIALDVDQRMTWYRSLDNICAVRSVRIISDAGDLSERAGKQHDLVNTFMDPETDEWMNSDLRASILGSFRENGKLFDRKLSIGEFNFSGFDDLYTRALGGVYVFRHKGTLALVVVEDESQRMNASDKLVPSVASITDDDIVRRIRDAEVADIDTRWYHEHIEVLEERLKTLALFVLSEDDPELPVHALKPAQLTGCLRKCSSSEMEMFVEFEEVIAKIREGEQVNNLSPSVETMLLHPVLVSSRYEENLVWQLICHVQKWPVDVMRLYVVNKNLFVKRYSTWSESMRALVRDQIVNHYEPSTTHNKRKE